MKKEHIFYTKKELLFDVIETALKDEVESTTNKKYQDLENVVYTQTKNNHKLTYHILKCNLEDGYHVLIKDGTTVEYTMSIELEELDPTKVKMVYTNEYHSKKTFRVLNYYLVSFVFKRSINKKYQNLVNYIEYKLKEKKV